MTTDQFTALRNAEWDTLVVLDACRWDYWHRLFDRGRRVRSPASCTKDWLAALTAAFDTEAWTCVTASPIQERHHAGAFGDRIDVWKTEWRQVNGIPTVPPRATTEAAKPYFDADGRLLVHYIQPHGPYAVGPQPLPVMRANPRANAVDLPAEDVPDRLVRNPMRLIHDDEAWLTAAMLREAYDANLKWVFDALLPLLNSGRDVVVTADHGEFLADGSGDGAYGHPCGNDHDLLRTVPFWNP